MQPCLWQPPIALSEQENQIVERIRRARLFVFLRRHRHDLFDEAFQQELATLYRPSKRGVQRFTVVDNSDFSPIRLTVPLDAFILPLKGALPPPHFKQ